MTLSNVKITATGGGGHGVMATQGGSVALADVDINTSGANSAPLATDRGGGTITATGGNVVASGTGLPGALLHRHDHREGRHVPGDRGGSGRHRRRATRSILSDVALSSAVADKWGVMIYQSMSGDAEGAQGHLHDDRRLPQLLAARAGRSST